MTGTPISPRGPTRSGPGPGSTELVATGLDTSEAALITQLAGLDAMYADKPGAVDALEQALALNKLGFTSRSRIAAWIADQPAEATG